MAISINALGLPAVALPVGIGDGLPQSVQVIGPRYREDRVPGLRERLAASVRTGEEGIEAWRARPELDAWITFESWYRATSSDTDFIPLSDDIGAVRATVIAITRWTPRRTLARARVHRVPAQPSRA